MKLRHWLKKENSGLFRSSIELIHYEEKAGHEVSVHEPSDDTKLYGVEHTPDVELVHSQLGMTSYHNRTPKFMWMHGEPLSSVGNGVSMKAIVDLSPLMEAFICMRKDEWSIWNSIKRTYVVPKGIDLEVFKPLTGDDAPDRLSGEPAVLYIENWRGQRNPLYPCVAMERVWRKYPKARLHLFNCNNEKMSNTFKALINNNKWWTFIRTLSGGVPHDQVNTLYNRADIVVSGLYPLYARGIECFGAGKAYIGPGYREHDYPWACELHPDSIADAIIACWENYNRVDYRKWAETHHDVAVTIEQSVGIYERYI